MPVSDQERAKLFYRDVLGFELLREEPMGPKQKWIQLAPQGCSTTIALVTWFDAMRPGVAFVNIARGQVRPHRHLFGMTAQLRLLNCVFEISFRDRPAHRLATILAFTHKLFPILPPILPTVRPSWRRSVV